MSVRTGSRQRIIAAAERVFSARGYHGASMDDIAGAAGVAKGTLYYNFRSKADLFETLVREGLDGLTARIMAIVEADLPMRERIARVVAAQVDTLIDRPDFAAILGNDMTSGFEADVAGRIRDVRSRYISFLAGLIAEGQHAGALRPVDPELAASSMLDVILSGCEYLRARARSGAAERARVQGFLETLLLDGMFIS